MKVKKLVALVVLLVLAGALMAACTGQGGTTSSGGGDNNTQVSSTGVSTTTPGNVSAFDTLPEKPVRVATTEEDYQILKGGSEIGKVIKDGLEAIRTSSAIDTAEVEGGQKIIQMGNSLAGSESEDSKKYCYYEKSNLGHTTKTLYYPISGLPIFGEYGNLIGTYGDIPVLEVDANIDAAVALKNQGFTAYKCKLIGCSIGWVGSESAIWNQNDLIPISDPSSLQLVDLSGQPRSTPMDYEFGEELTAECDGQSYQIHADCYIYAISEQGVTVDIETTKVSRGGRTANIYTYDLSKLEPGLYYFQDLGVYKIV